MMWKKYKNYILAISIVILLILAYNFYKVYTGKEAVENFDIKEVPKEDNLFLLLTTRINDSYDPDSKTWKDLSNNNNNLKWKSTPPNKSGSLVVTKQKGIIKSDKKPNKKDFTIFIECKTISSNNMSESNILFIPGNEKEGLLFKLDNEYGNVHLKMADKKLKFEKKIMTNDNNMYTIVKDDNKVKLYVNGSLLEKVKLKNKIYFSEDNILVNKTEDSNFELTTLAIYNNAMNSSEVETTTDYLKNIKPSKPEPVPGSDSKCMKLCQDECSQSGNYKDCYETCAFRIPECKKFCEKNPSIPICNTKCKDYDKCPTAYTRDGTYYVYVVKDSIYADELGRYGEISYGRDRANAKEIYSMNFPDCKIPDILDDNAPNPTNDSCPFVVKSHNPCKSKNCRDIDWNDNPLKADINKKCRKNIASYCDENYDKDEACYCWKPKYQDDRYCSKFRRHFDDQKCSPSQFDIDEHPDFYKYIKKDNIPCWNCNIPTKKPKKKD